MLYMSYFVLSAWSCMSFEPLLQELPMHVSAADVPLGIGKIDLRAGGGSFEPPKGKGGGGLGKGLS